MCVTMTDSGGEVGLVLVTDHHFLFLFAFLSAWWDGKEMFMMIMYLANY